MTVYVLISGTALPGKYREARKAVAESVKYLNGKQEYTGEYEAVRPQQGPNSQVTWLCRYASMADLEADADRRAQDPDWAKTFEQVNQTVDTDGITSQILRVFES